MGETIGDEGETVWGGVAVGRDSRNLEWQKWTKEKIPPANAVRAAPRWPNRKMPAAIAIPIRSPLASREIVRMTVLSRSI